MKEKLVIIGNGMAPGRALEKLFETDPDRYDVVIFNAEPRVNYDRIMLSPVLSGEKSFDDIVIHGDAWYIQHGITLYKGCKVESIDRVNKTVTSVNGITGSFAVNFAISPWAFIGLVFVLGFFMSLGKAAVYKQIPTYYPQNVGAVGGLVGMIGGLGGFILPLLFGWLNDVTGLWSSCFMALFVLVIVSLALMHTAVRRIGRTSATQPA